jgi:hypothetical protein
MKENPKGLLDRGGGGFWGEIPKGGAVQGEAGAVVFIGQHPRVPG